MTSSTDVAPVRSAVFGAMSPHTARAYAGDLLRFTAWIGDRSIAPEAG